MQVRPGAVPMIGLVIGLGAVLTAFVGIMFPQVPFVTFLLFTASVTTASALSILAPREIGHLLAVIVGAAAMIAGFAAFAKGMPSVLPLTLFIAGGLIEVLALFSWNKSRVSWSFLIAMCGVLFICMFFGAPKVKGVLKIDIWIALIFPGLLAAATIALSVLHRDYDSGAREPAATPSIAT